MLLTALQKDCGHFPCLELLHSCFFKNFYELCAIKSLLFCVETFYAFPYLPGQTWATKQTTTTWFQEECKVAIKSKRKLFCIFEQYSLGYITAEVEQAIELKSTSKIHPRYKLFKSDLLLWVKEKSLPAMLISGTQNILLVCSCFHPPSVLPPSVTKTESPRPNSQKGQFLAQVTSRKHWICCKTN